MLARVVLDVLDQEYLGICRQQVFFDDVDLELAEAAAKRDVLLVCEMLIPEKHDDVVVKNALELGEGAAVDRPRQVEDDFRPQGGVAFSHRDRHRLHSTAKRAGRPESPGYANFIALFAGARGGAERENADDTPAAAVRAGERNGEDLMKSIVIAAGVLLAATALSPAPAAAAGCLKGAVVGGVAGHFMHRHGVLGATAGCLVGRHEANKQARQQAQQSQTANTNYNSR